MFTRSQMLAKAAEIQARHGRPLKSSPASPESRCIHLGKPVKGAERIALQLAVGRSWHHCDKGHGIVCPCGRCKGCADKQAEDESSGPVTLATFDHLNLFPELKQWRLNGSIIDDGDGYLFAFRSGWRRSNIYLCRMTADFKPVDVRRLNLRCEASAYGREDPRLWRHLGRLMVTYCGVISRGGAMSTSVLHAEIGGNFRTTIFQPVLPVAPGWQKNHSPFSHGGQMYAVYGTHVHQVMRFDRERAEMLPATKPFPWRYGEARGGAAPVRVGSHWWHWFHSRHVVNGRQTYVTGVYEFEDKSPFRILRYVPEPIIEADPATNTHEQPGGYNYADVLFTCGAVLSGDRFILSSGEHDRRVVIQAIGRDELERRMVRL